MKKLLIEKGYTFTEKKDLTNNQFTFIGITSERDEILSTLAKIKTMHTMAFQFRIKKLDLEDFVKDMESLQYVRSSDALYPKVKNNIGVYYCDFHSIGIENEENSYLINVDFTIKEG